MYADKPQEEYDRLFNAKQKLKELYKEKPANDIGVTLITEEQNQELAKSEEQLEKEVYTDKKEENFVELIMQEINPKFSILPGSLYKTVVAVTEPQHLRGKRSLRYEV